MVWSESPQERESTTWNVIANKKPDNSRGHQFISVLDESSKSGIRRYLRMEVGRKTERQFRLMMFY